MNDFSARHQFQGEVEPTPSTLAYRLTDLLRVCFLAEDNDSSGLFANGKGLGSTLQLAQTWAGELTEQTELLEMRTRKAEAAESPVQTMHKEWQSKFEAANRLDHQKSAEHALEELADLEGRIINAPSTCAADVAIKLVTITNNFDFEITGSNAQAFFAELEVLTGVKVAKNDAT